MTFDCPRCHAGVDEEFYGPCSSCRDTLRASGAAPRSIEPEAYEPRSNVIPNQVATKE